MDAKPWIRWNGGRQPVDDEVWVEVMHATKNTNAGPARCFGRKYKGEEIGWRSVGDKYDIIAYRLAEPPVSEREQIMQELADEAQKLGLYDT